MYNFGVDWSNDWNISSNLNVIIPDILGRKITEILKLQM